MKYLSKYNELFNFFKKKEEITDEDIPTIEDIFMETADQLKLFEYKYPGIRRNYFTKRNSYDILKDQSTKINSNLYKVYKEKNKIYVDTNSKDNKWINLNIELEKFKKRLEKFDFNSEARFRFDINPEFVTIIITH